MKVLVEFGRTYAGPPLDAVWIIDTPENRAWFEKHVDSIDPWSAVFDEDVEPLTAIWHVLDHHPEWTEIVVRGAGLTPELKRGLQPDAVVTSNRPDEFRLKRP